MSWDLLGWVPYNNSEDKRVMNAMGKSFKGPPSGFESLGRVWASQHGGHAMRHPVEFTLKGGLYQIIPVHYFILCKSPSYHHHLLTHSIISRRFMTFPMPIPIPVRQQKCNQSQGTIYFYWVSTFLWESRRDDDDSISFWRDVLDWSEKAFPPLHGLPATHSILPRTPYWILNNATHKIRFHLFHSPTLWRRRRRLPLNYYTFKWLVEVSLSVCLSAVGWAFYF